MPNFLPLIFFFILKNAYKTICYNKNCRTEADYQGGLVNLVLLGAVGISNVRVRPIGADRPILPNGCLPIRKRTFNSKRSFGFIGQSMPDSIPVDILKLLVQVKSFTGIR